MEVWQCLSNLTSLRDLSLDSFRLVDLPAEVLLLTKLTRLCILHGLENLNRSLSPLENLLELHLSYEKFWSIPAMLSTCRSLETLVMVEGPLEVSSESIDVLTCLPRLRQLTFDRGDAVWRDAIIPGVEQLAREKSLVELSCQ